jgi:hypothetical protein
MAEPLKILLVEDNEADAELLLRELKCEGLDCRSLRVQTEPDFRKGSTSSSPTSSCRISPCRRSTEW